MQRSLPHTLIFHTFAGSGEDVAVYHSHVDSAGKFMAQTDVSR